MMENSGLRSKSKSTYFWKCCPDFFNFRLKNWYGLVDLADTKISYIFNNVIQKYALLLKIASFWVFKMSHLFNHGHSFVLGNNLWNIHKKFLPVRPKKPVFFGRTGKSFLCMFQRWLPRTRLWPWLNKWHFKNYWREGEEERQLQSC